MKEVHMREAVNSTSGKKYILALTFAGVELGIENTSEFSTVYANEFDKSAKITYSTNFKNVHLGKRDIREVETEDVPEVDIITGGFPGQTFSIAGYRKGFKDEERHLLTLHTMPHSFIIKLLCLSELCACSRSCKRGSIPIV